MGTCVINYLNLLFIKNINNTFYKQFYVSRFSILYCKEPHTIQAKSKALSVLIRILYMVMVTLL